MVEAFSLLAIGTSIIGTLLGFSEFFKEQLKNLSGSSNTTQFLQVALFSVFLTLPYGDQSPLHLLNQITNATRTQSKTVAGTKEALWVEEMVEQK